MAWVTPSSDTSGTAWLFSPPFLGPLPTLTAVQPEVAPAPDMAPALHLVGMRIHSYCAGMQAKCKLAALPAFHHSQWSRSTWSRCYTVVITVDPGSSSRMQPQAFVVLCLLACSRCRVLLHVLDGTSPDPVGDYKAIQLELELFNPALLDKPQVRGEGTAGPELNCGDQV